MPWPGLRVLGANSPDLTSGTPGPTDDLLAEKVNLIGWDGQGLQFVQTGPFLICHLAKSVEGGHVALHLGDVSPQAASTVARITVFIGGGQDHRDPYAKD